MFVGGHMLVLSSGINFNLVYRQIPKFKHDYVLGSIIFVVVSFRRNMELRFTNLVEHQVELHSLNLNAPIIISIEK